MARELLLMLVVRRNVNRGALICAWIASLVGCSASDDSTATAQAFTENPNKIFSYYLERIFKNLVTDAFDKENPSPAGHDPNALCGVERPDRVLFLVDNKEVNLLIQPYGVRSFFETPEKPGLNDGRIIPATSSFLTRAVKDGHTFNVYVPSGLSESTFAQFLQRKLVTLSSCDLLPSWSTARPAEMDGSKTDVYLEEATTRFDVNILVCATPYVNFYGESGVQFAKVRITSV